MTGSTTWRLLLRRALTALDSVSARNGTPPSWRFGGGTVLGLRYGHRTSRDIDLFFHDAQVLTYLTPRLNDAVARLTDEYVESSTALRLSFPEGEIDFIVAPTLTGLAPVPLAFDERTVATDPSVEIVAKKAFYRASSLKVRDIVDLALVLAREPDARLALASILGARRAALTHRFAALESTFATRLTAEVDLLPGGATAATRALADVAAFVAGLPPTTRS